MKRHPSLIPLSRFHRSVLFLALVCKKNAPPVKGYPEDDDGKRDYALTFYKKKLKLHMDLEETRLFPEVVGINAQLKTLVQELLAEHKAIDQLFAELPTTGNLPDTLDRLGILLESHVRKEERQFFQLIQQSLEETELVELEELLH
ncbi:MAG: hemerythrin domain-containing protein [Roseivirga sp.]|nr:hemerythrin domain-containing protein [Roseivirga sp.]